MASAVGVDDYALSRVPSGARYSWWSVAVQRFGQISALSQFLLGATLGFGMGFWQAFLALTLGAVILEVVAVFVGVIGVREGLSTSMLARWTGFGRAGSAVIGLAIGISLIAGSASSRRSRRRAWRAWWACCPSGGGRWCSGWW